MKKKNPETFKIKTINYIDVKDLLPRISKWDTSLKEHIIGYLEFKEDFNECFISIDEFLENLKRLSPNYFIELRKKLNKYENNVLIKIK